MTVFGLGLFSPNTGKPCSVRLNDQLGITGDNAKPLGENMTTAVEPIYFVKHIDDTFSVADPQPTVNSIFDLPDTQSIANELHLTTEHVDDDSEVVAYGPLQ